MQFSYKVFLFPKPANREAGADLAVEFVKFDPNNPEEMTRIKRAVALIKPPATTISGHAGGLTSGLEGVPVRIVTDGNAIPVRAINYDETHPYRQMELRKRVNELLPDGVEVTTYDLTSVKYAHCVARGRDYYYKSKFGAAQYSESYARWLAFSYQEDREFFVKARARYYEDHR